MTTSHLYRSTPFSKTTPNNSNLLFIIYYHTSVFRLRKKPSSFFFFQIILFYQYFFLYYLSSQFCLFVPSLSLSLSFSRSCFQSFIKKIIEWIWCTSWLTPNVFIRHRDNNSKSSVLLISSPSCKHQVSIKKYIFLALFLVSFLFIIPLAFSLFILFYFIGP